MSVVVQNCLDTAIGLSQTSCDCFDDGKPINYAVSDSGLYLADLDGLPLNLIEAVADCESGNAWELMEKAIREASIRLKGDVNIGLSKNIVPSRNFFNGNIGDSSPKGYANPNGQYTGITWVTDAIPSGSMRIKKVRIALNTSGNKTLYLYSSLDLNTPLQTIVINAVANRYTEATVDIALPMTDGGAYGVRYWLIYDKTGIQPMNTKLHCGCGWIPSFSGLGFIYDRKTAKTAYNWKEWINVAGTWGNDLNAMETWGTSTSYTYGIQLQVEFDCSISDVLCQNLDYETNPAGIKLAEILRYKAGEIVINYVLSSGTINRYTMLDNEALYGRRNHYRKQYTDMLAEALKAMDVSRTGCYKCKPGMSIGTI
jgi:hypothetical protein